jgi:hypothetical protein
MVALVMVSQIVSSGEEKKKIARKTAGHTTGL